MAHQVLFIQGGGEDAHRWDTLLAESLRRALGSDCEVRFPRMPNEAEPNYARWKAALIKEFAELGDGAILAGHSIGGTILINVLAERASSFAPGAILLIAAPFIGKGGWHVEDIEPRADLGARLPHGVPVFMYHGDSDETAPVSHLALYARAIPHARVRQLAHRDHQLNNDLSEVAKDIRELA